MSYPTGQALMATIAEDESLPTGLRIAVIRDKSYRPTAQSLLRIIRNPNTPPKLKAVATLRYSQLTALREIRNNARRAKRSSRPEEIANDDSVNTPGPESNRSQDSGTAVVYSCTGQTED